MRHKTLPHTHTAVSVRRPSVGCRRYLPSHSHLAELCAFSCWHFNCWHQGISVKTNDSGCAPLIFLNLFLLITTVSGKVGCKGTINCISNTVSQDLSWVFLEMVSNYKYWKETGWRWREWGPATGATWGTPRQWGEGAKDTSHGRTTAGPYLKACRSSMWRAVMVALLEEHTSSFSSPGCLPVSSTMVAAPFTCTP